MKLEIPTMQPRLMTIASAVVLIVTSTFAASASAQTFFSMDYSSANSPNGGWGAVALAPNYARSRIAGAGPTGQDVYELRQLYAPTTMGYGGQFYWGWAGGIEASDPPQGAKRYYRWRMRFSPDTNFRGLDWGDGSPSGLSNKLLIVGDGCGRSCRFILEYYASPDTGQVRNFRIQLDGGVHMVDTGPFPIGQWLNIQIEVDSSSSASTADGGFKIWVNNDPYSTPTAQRTGITLNPVNWKYVVFGGYMNYGVRSDGVHTIRQTDFQASTSFDPSWNSGDRPPTPEPPTDVVVQ